MLQSRLDWLTLTIKPDVLSDKPVKEFQECVDVLSDVLMLEPFFDRCKELGKRAHYEKVLAYENVQVCFPYVANYCKEGFSIIISSQGLDYFTGYLKWCGVTLIEWLAKFRELSFRGFITKCTRFDFAFDDITLNDENSIISMKRVLWALEDGECCMKNRVWSDDGADFSRLCRSYRRTKRIKQVDYSGITVNLGVRKKTEFMCRFYDKFAEQMQKNGGSSIPKNCKAWTRFEMELHDDKSMCALNSLIDNSEDDFLEHIRGVALNQVRFVERTSNNVSRCVTKRWWREFLNGATKAFRLTSIKPARSALCRWSKWFKTEIFPSLNTARKYFDDDVQFLYWLDSIELQLSSEHKHTVRKDLWDNLRDDRRYYEFADGFTTWEYNSEFPKERFRDGVGLITRPWYDKLQAFRDRDKEDMQIYGL